MEKKIKIAAIGKIIHGNRLIRKVGLDTDIMVALIDDDQQFSMFKPRIFNRKNILFINYVVFSELIGYFKFNKGFSMRKSRDKIFLYLRKNNIVLLKQKETNLDEVDKIIFNLEKQRKILRNNAGNKDLKIISVYKWHRIDLIFSRNAHHFKLYCDYLGISFEQLQEDIDVMWRNVFGWKKRKC